MDFRERLLKTDIRHLNENIQILSDELMVLHEFIRVEFGVKYTKFLEGRKLKTPEVKPGNAKLQRLQRSVRKGRSRGGGANEEPESILPHEIIPDVLADGEIVIVSTESTVGFPSSLANDDGNGQVNNFEEQIFEEKYGCADADGNHSNKNSTPEDSSGSDSDSDYAEGKSPATNKRKYGKSSASIAGTKQPRKGLGRNKSKTQGKAPRSCPICKASVDRSKLKDHVQNHSREEADEKLVCSYCCISFPSQRRFDSHKEKYHGKPDDLGDKGTCRFCGKICGGNYRRIEHERSHTGERPYECLLCEDIKFTRRDNLNRHMRIVHEKE